ncbi:molybdate ABC transporter substrate-binding protein [Niallia sp. XMNu-256]|uniref:molybdate ABC transporter substrate-binding protein n=1 Tax=Niallia sp. XMNu-256 TaxID=3082444 RepID=UPI0030CAAA87
MKRWFLFASIILALLFASSCANNKNTDKQETEGKNNVELTVSAAASLADAMNVIQKAYQAEHPEVTLRFNFGASGSLQQQVSQGAPVDLFFSAAEDKFDLLVEEGVIAEEDGMDLLGNELVLIVPKEGSMIKNFEDLAKAGIDKISIGTPETVPAGKYARESLENIGLWKDAESKIVYAKDVRQVLSYVGTGNVEAGMVYKTDALGSDQVEIIATAETDTHTPIVYPVGVIKDSEHYEAAKDFYEYLQNDEALKVFEKYGFTIK